MTVCVEPAMIGEYEGIIRQIKDVVSARIVTTTEGEIQEIHVLACQSRSPKQLVRDIESAVMAKFGVALDHKKISIAQIQGEMKEEGKAQLRPRLVSVNLTTTGVAAEAKVGLKIGEVVYQGVTAGPGATNNKMRLIVQATINAIEDFLRGTCSFAVEEVAIIPMGRQQAAVVALSLVTPDGEEALIGGAFIKQDEREGIVKATLGAINRKLSILKGEG
ncbi:MAG: hypothetical protein M0Z31_05360 [Clostridia bacterium]|nr:hypothetical protein [Clostridia bacterium]